MPHKFWTVRPRIVEDGVNTIAMPGSMPPGAQWRTTVPGDLMVAGGAHNHCIIGGNFGAPNVGSPGHYHWFIRKPAGQIEQITIGAAQHNHTGDIGPNSRVLPKFYLLLVTCDDAAFTAFSNAGWLIFARRPYDAQTETFGPLSTAAWTAAKRTAAENKIANGLGLELPSMIDTDKEFIIWLLDVGAYRYEKEDKHD